MHWEGFVEAGTIGQKQRCRFFLFSPFLLGRGLTGGFFLAYGWRWSFGGNFLSDLSSLFFTLYHGLYEIHIYAHIDCPWLLNIAISFELWDTLQMCFLVTSEWDIFENKMFYQPVFPMSLTLTRKMSEPLWTNPPKEPTKSEQQNPIPTVHKFFDRVLEKPRATSAQQESDKQTSSSFCFTL